MRYRLHNIEIWPVIRIMFPVIWFLYLIFGLGILFIIVAGVNLFSSILEPSYFETDYSASARGASLGVVLVIFLSTGAALLNTIFSALFIFIYNIFASKSGGFIVHLAEVENIPPKQPLKTGAGEAIEDDEREEE